ncbi:amidophosphoribosyltransferase [Pueribacillus sp. YX66]|uniref:amidophosphoribosyltransferase n=1 Tax=Pueribacillus sp. YX66 TaxID=3229242 RepID=UPI00358D8277
MFGIWGHEDAAQIAYYGLHSLQHRGQEGAGIVVNNGKELKVHKDIGLVNDVFGQRVLEELKGKSAIGHVRYTTAGGRGYENIQPLLFRSMTGGISVAHNGNLTNAYGLKHQLESQGSIFQTTSDSEVLVHLIKRSAYVNLEDAFKSALSMIKGAYAFLVMTENKLMVALDPSGIRPLSLGKLGEAYVVASETCAFDTIGADYIRDVKPGELIVISDEGLHSEMFSTSNARSMCGMEYIYFSRPDSDINQMNIHTARKNLGKQLALEAPADADVVTGVPDSSISAAIGYAEESGIPYELGLIKNRYVGRTFIQPSQTLREQGVKMKLSPVRGVVEGKRVVMVDDSIVRGTTIRRIVKLLREAGAKEIHVRISAPPIKNPCYYGIDMKTKEELIAANHSIEEIKEEVGADSIAFISIDGMLKALESDGEGIGSGHCLACFTGKYPTEIYNNSPSEHVRKYNEHV